MVSNKMISAALDNISKNMAVDAEATAQGVVDAAWNKFDPDDESTWPDDGVGIYYVIVPKTETYYCAMTYAGRGVWIAGGREYKHVIKYASPRHFMPEGVRNEDLHIEMH